MEEYYDFSCNPLAAWLTVNQACNMRCKWCYGEAINYDPSKEMSLDLAKELVDISIETGVSHFNIIGGEPTVWPHLLSLFSYIKEKNVTVGLITNATLFSDDTFWEAYKSNPADRISISVKSNLPSEFKDVTGCESFNQTMLGIERAINFHKTGVTTVYNSLVGLNGLKHIAKECKKVGANSIIVNMCSPVIDNNGEAQVGYSIDLSQLSDDVVEIVDYLNELYDGEAEVDVQMPLCIFPEKFVENNLAKNKLMTLCQIFSRSGINFNVDGDVNICNELTIDNIAKKGVDFSDGKSLLTHLNSDVLREFYSQILRYPAECCEECKWKNRCRGGCLMNWLIQEPSICHAIN